LREGMPHTIVGDAIKKLEEELWYLHSEKNQYYFRTQPNLNRVIVEKEETIAEQRIKERLKELLQKHAGKELEVYIWPQSPADIPDNKKIKLAILSPDLPETEELASEIFEKSGTEGFRVYKNTLFFLAIDRDQYVLLSKSLRRLLALEEIKNHKEFLRTLTEESKSELQEKLKEEEKGLLDKIFRAYRYLAIPTKDGLEWKDLGIAIVGTANISQRVKEYLKNQEKIFSRITPKYIIDKAFGEDETEKTLKDIHELFLKTPGMPLLETEEVLKEAVREGAKVGLMAVKQNAEVYYRQDVLPDLDLDSFILRGKLAKEIKETEEKVEEIKEEREEKANVVKRLTLRAKVPYGRFHDVVRGVISPLKSKSDEIETIIEIKAESKNGFDKNLLENTVEETLKQVGAEWEWNLE